MCECVCVCVSVSVCYLCGLLLPAGLLCVFAEEQNLVWVGTGPGEHALLIHTAQHLHTHTHAPLCLSTQHSTSTHTHMPHSHTGNMLVPVWMGTHSLTHTHSDGAQAVQQTGGEAESCMASSQDTHTLPACLTHHFLL